MRLPFSDHFDIAVQDHVDVLGLSALLDEQVIPLHLVFMVEGQNFSELIRGQVLVDWQLLKEISLCLQVLLLDLLQHLAVVVAGPDRQLAGAGRRDGRCPLIIAKQCLLPESLAL